MGIKFDVLYNELLLEDSSLSSLFIDSGPLNVLHKLLKLPHNVDIKMSPTKNRASKELGELAKQGNGILFGIYNTKDIRDIASQLILHVENLKPTPKTTQTVNELKITIPKLITKYTNPNITSKEALEGVKYIGGVIDKVSANLPNHVIASLLRNLQTALQNREYILIKRVPSNVSEVSPSEYSYDIAQSGKTRNQEYLVIHFNNKRIIDKTVENNITGLMYELTSISSANQDDKFTPDVVYIIDKSNFRNAAPNILSNKDNPEFEKILPLLFMFKKINKPNPFVVQTLEKFSKIIANRYNQVADKAREKMVSTASDIEASDEQIKTDVQAYRHILRTLKKGTSAFDTHKLLAEFLLSEISTKTVQKYSGVDQYKQTRFGNLDPLNTASVVSPTDVTVRGEDGKSRSISINKLENSTDVKDVWNPLTNEWIPFDSANIDAFKQIEDIKFVILTSEDSSVSTIYHTGVVDTDNTRSKWSAEDQITSSQKLSEQLQRIIKNHDFMGDLVRQLSNTRQSILLRAKNNRSTPFKVQASTAEGPGTLTSYLDKIDDYEMFIDGKWTSGDMNVSALYGLNKYALGFKTIGSYYELQRRLIKYVLSKTADTATDTTQSAVDDLTSML